MNPSVNDTNIFIAKDKLLLRYYHRLFRYEQESELASYSYYIN